MPITKPLKLTRKDFDDYIYLGNEIERMKRTLNRQMEKRRNDGSTHGVVKGSAKHFPYTECHFVISGSDVKDVSELEKDIRRLEIDIDGNTRIYEQKQLEIALFIEEQVKDIEMKTILGMKFCEGATYEEIATMIYSESSTVRKKLKRYLESLK